MPPPPELMEELVEEILVHFPPDDPASLVRAALVCKSWCCLVSGTAFCRRFREFHLKRRAPPPLLGVLYTNTTEGVCCHKQQQVRDDDDEDTDDRCIKSARILREPKPTACFVPTTSSFLRGPAHAANNSRRFYGWRAIDARHGRVLLRRNDRSPYGHGLSVWDPVTDEQRDLPKPSISEMMLGYNWTAAVVCADTAGGNCDHLDCHRGPFLVIIMDVQDHVILRSVYSSEAGAWSRLDALPRAERAISFREFKQTPSVLVGSALYFLVHCNDEVVEYDLATQDYVSMIYMPSEFYRLLEQRGVVLMTDDDGGLGFVANTTNTEHQLELWSMVNGGEGGFVQTGVIDLHKVLIPSSSAPALINNSLRVNGFGFADGGATATRFLFMRTSDGLYSIDINSSHVRKVANCCGDNVVVPYISFCTPNSFVTATPSASGNTAMSYDQAPRRSNRTRRPNPRWTGEEWTS